VLVLCATGCFLKPDPPVIGDAAPGDGIVGDGFEPRSCLTDFDPLATMTLFQGSSQGDPSLREDQLQLYFTELPNGNYDIAVAARAATDQNFQVSTGSSSLNDATENDLDANFTLDPNRIAFVSDRSGNRRAYLAERADDASPWMFGIAPGLAMQAAESIDISHDALVIYGANLANDLWSARRASVANDFVVGPAIGQNIRFPTVSADGLEVYYNGTGSTIWRARRPSTTDMFGPGEDTMIVGFDPDLSFDGERLVYFHNGVKLATRECD
jgi:hypothetical protein